MRAFIVFLVLMLSRSVFAFPDMVRHGYTHCTACHTTLTGGGLLNEYGRGLSKELLSQVQFGKIKPDDETPKFAYGAFNTPPNLLLGADFRALQYFSESSKASRGRFLIMQADFDASWQVSERVRVFGSIGRIEPRDADTVARDYVTSPRHGIEYLITKPDSDNRVTIRAGRFMPAYGINFAEHTFVTREPLSFGPARERYAVELAWNNESSSVIATGLLSQTDGNKSAGEDGGILQYARALGEGNKIGVNYYRSRRYTSSSDYTKREMFGVFAHLKFSEKWYGLFEIDQVRNEYLAHGVAEIFKVGYEAWQGFHLIGVQEYSSPERRNTENQYTAYSTGFEWFPAPHWDFYSLYRREHNTQTDPKSLDALWFIFHYYL